MIFVVAPCISTLMGVLHAITGPLLSISLISGICALGDMDTLKGTGVRAILRIMVWVIIMFVVCAVVSSLFYGGAIGTSETSFNPSELFNLLLSAIPANLFSPFVEGNSLQIAVESASIGVCILALGEHSTIIRKLVVELNSLMFKMMYIFSKLLPALVFLTIFQVLTTTDVSSLKDIGLIVAVNFACVAAIVVGVFIWVRVSLQISPLLFVRKLWPAVYLSLTTGSSSSAMGEFFRISSEELGIRKTIVDFWAPLGHAMFSSSAIVPLVVGMFAAECSFAKSMHAIDEEKLKKRKK